jgi:hypothetical protein
MEKTVAAMLPRRAKGADARLSLSTLATGRQLVRSQKRPIVRFREAGLLGMLARAACPTWEGTENEPLATDTEVCLPDDPTAFKGRGSSLIARRRLSLALSGGSCKTPFSGAQTRIRGRTDRNQSVKLVLFCKRLNEFSGRCTGYRFHCAGKYAPDHGSIIIAPNIK